MTVSREFLDHVEDALVGLGGVRVRRMFGGAGLYWQDVFFAILSGETLYFRVDGATEPDYIAARLYRRRLRTLRLPTARQDGKAALLRRSRGAVR
ncbi:MAG: TfoX/Sxy family protein [Sphingomonadales bacterium]|nr:TfoX/Sxy family protein [Sphingomonadales bacterium]